MAGGRNSSHRLDNRMWVRARYVVPLCGPPIKHGAIRIERGRIREIISSKKKPADGPDVDFGSAVVLPGFVNAHTHLELTHLAGRVMPGADFTDWLRRLMREFSADARLAESAGECVEDRFAASAMEGMRLSLAAGVTLVGDVTSHCAAVREALSHGPLRVVSFGEVIAIGAIRGRLADRLQIALDASSVSETLSIGVSPHAPYTMESDGISTCVEMAGERGLPMCMHLGETRDEVEFTLEGTGAFRAYLEGMGLYDSLIQCPKLSPGSYADRCGVLSARTVLAHGNYLSDAEVELVALRGAHVAYCPRTHAAFGHEAHPYEKMLAAGVNVCIGTDSLASNPSLSVLDEIRFVRRGSDSIEGVALLEMGTIRGARALGMGDECGTIEVGKRADLCVVPLDGDGASDPVENMLASTHAPIATFVGGERLKRTRSA